MYGEQAFGWLRSNRRSTNRRSTLIWAHSSPLYGEQRPPPSPWGSPPLNTWGSPPLDAKEVPPIAAKATLPLDAAERLRRGLREALRDGDHDAARELASTLRAFPHHFAYKEVSQ